MILSYFSHFISIWKMRSESSFAAFITFLNSIEFCGPATFLIVETGGFKRAQISAIASMLRLCARKLRESFSSRSSTSFSRVTSKQIIAKCVTFLPSESIIVSIFR